MKFLKKNIEQIYKNSKSGLEKEACKYVLDKWADYKGDKAIITEVLQYGCQSGIVSSLIYYSDTIKFYNNYKDEINSLLYELLADCGVNDPQELFGKKWDEEDPLALDTHNQNLLAWFGFEEALRKLAYNFEELEEYI